MSRRTSRSGAGALGLLIATTLGLSACSWPDVTMSPGVSSGDSTTDGTTVDTAGADTSASGDSPAEAGDEPAPVEVVRPAGDLDTGSITQKVSAGDRTVVIDYWTDEDVTSWTPGDTKSVELSAHVEGGKADTLVSVTRFAATADDGTARSTAIEDSGEFDLSPPFSYSTAFTLPESESTATSVTLYVQFDLLVETEPESGRYYRQTVLDSIELPLLEEDSP
jgi:hypothetical protein